MCLSKFSISVGSEGVAANYLYVIFPILFYWKLRTKIILSWEYKLLSIVIMIVFLFGILLDYLGEFKADRRLASFLIFTSIFTFIFVNINKTDVKLFKFSIVIASSLYSIITIYSWVKIGSSLDISSAKSFLGSQRYGFVLIFALWILIYSPKDISQSSIVRILLLLLVFLAIFLTFSRTTYFSLIGVSIFILIEHLISMRNSLLLSLKFYISLVVLSLILYFIYKIPIFNHFIYTRIIDEIFIANTLLSNVETTNDSAGHRLYVWKYTLSNLLQYPLIGSAFLGSWSIENLSFAGSFHSQYIDNLSRLGIIGFILFYILIFKLLFHLFYHHKSLFYGLLSCLFYGFFHETFKESHGAFILAFLIGMHTNLKHNKSFIV